MKSQEKKSQKPFPEVTIIVAMRNSATTILHTLKSIAKQEYPINEILVIDNISTDNSIALVKEFAHTSKIPVSVLQQKINRGVGASYNRGAKVARTDLIVFMHSDSSLLTPNEIEKLSEPIRSSEDVVAAYPTVLMPEKVWEKFNFWEKCLFARAVGKKSPGMNGKFDCIRRNVFLEIGGFDVETFGDDPTIGGEDADLYLRLSQKGKLVLSTAEVVHLHFLGKNYSLLNWISNRKLLARTYGRLARTQGSSLPLNTHGMGLKLPLGLINFSIKPALAVFTIIPYIWPMGLLVVVLYCFLNSKKMYLTSSTRSDPKILFLPFIEFGLLYYEAFWTIQAFIFTKRGV